MYYKEKVDRAVILEKMMETLSHRGPDAQSSYHDEHCYLGFTRLTFVGGAASIQPLYNEDKSLALICNGEIYNYRELRKKLGKKHKFLTYSDCEVIVHLYEELKENLVYKLHGQFAFVLWDRKRGKLFATRDRFGICPLFYYKNSEKFIFASEMKAILQDKTIVRSFDPQGLAETAFIYSPTAPRTCFNNIYRIPPGHTLSIDLSSWGSTLKSYWSLPLLQSGPKKRKHDFTKIKNELKARLKKVTIQYATHGDKEVGISISGGIDSSALAYFGRKSGVIKTSFGIKFTHQKFDESFFQRKIAKLLDLKHYEMVCDDESIVRSLPQVVWSIESPLFRTAPIPLFIFAKFIYDLGFRSVLSGEGADELFCGYPIFFEGEIRTAFLRNKSDKRAKKAIEQFLHKELTFPELQRMKNDYSTDSGLFSLFPSHYSRWQGTKKLLSLFRDDYLERGADTVALKALKTIIHKSQNSVTSLAWAQAGEIFTKQEGYILSNQGDRVFMAHAIEKRLPYLDEELSAFVLQIDENFRQHGEDDKYILRETMRDLLPAEIVNRPKQGYLAPNDSLFFLPNAKNSYIGDLLSTSLIKKSGYFKPEVVKNIVSRFNNLNNEKERKFIESAFVFIITTQLLHQLFIEKTNVSVFN